MFSAVFQHNKANYKKKKTELTGKKKFILSTVIFQTPVPLLLLLIDQSQLFKSIKGFIKMRDRQMSNSLWHTKQLTHIEIFPKCPRLCVSNTGLVYIAEAC